MINENNAKAYCCEDIALIENYDMAIADTTRTWDCHHKLEIQGKFRNSRRLLKKCGLYYKVPAWQLIFLTQTEHRRLPKHLSHGNVKHGHGPFWWNNGSINTLSKECPGPEWKRV